MQIKVLVFPPSLLSAGLTKLLSEKGLEISDDPDVVVVDIGQGVHAVGETRQRFPSAKLVILASKPLAVEAVLNAYQQERISACSTTDDIEFLVLLLQMAVAGQTILPQEVIEHLLTHQPAKANGIGVPVLPGTVQLSVREKEILLLLRQGLANKEIARRLACAEATIKVHVKGILRKLRLKNRTQAALWSEIRVV